MTLFAIEGHYSNGQIALNEEPPGVEKARVIVTFLPEHLLEQEKEIQREEAIKWLFARMEQGVDLGGGPYYTRREDIYDERLDRLDKSAGG